MRKWLMALVLAGAAVLSPVLCPMDAPAAVVEAAQAPDAAIMQIGSGEASSIAALSNNRPLYLNFWASWCPPCVGEMPSIDALYRKYGEQMNFACVSVDSSEADARAFYEKAGLSVPLFYGDAAAICQAYDIQAIPVSLLVAPGGEIIDSHIGGMNESELEAFLKKAL